MIFRGPSPAPELNSGQALPKGKGEKTFPIKFGKLFSILFFCLGINFSTSALAQTNDSIAHSSLQNFPAESNGKHFINIHLGKTKESLSLVMDPLLQSYGGIDVSSKNKTFDLLAGINTEVKVKDKIVFDLKAAKGFAQLATYQNKFVQDHEVMPGLAYAYSYKDGYSYNYLASTLWYKPSKHFYLQLGYDKNFIGDGYRSLLLSDNASNYPFIKLSTTVWKFKYVNLFAQFNDIRDSNGERDLFKKKFGAFHYLDWEIHKRFTIGLFEAIIWHKGDSSAYRGFDVNYLNPIIFYRPVEFSVGSPDNALLGLNAKLKLWKHTYLYTQIMLDEFLLKHVRDRDGWWANKQAVQLGAKAYQVLGVENLFVQTEINYVRPFTYSHYTVLKNYGHYNQALAHPLGSNFIESVNFITYQYKKLYFEFETMFALKGENKDSLNYGANIYDSYVSFAQEFGNYTGQGLKTYILYNSLKCSFILNSTNQLGFFIQLADRREYSTTDSDQTTLIMVGIQICPVKRYWDF